MHRLTTPERDSFLQAAPDWRPLPDRDAIRREFRFPDFEAAWSFMGRVAAIAARLDHHPEWSNSYNRVSIVLTTHDAGGLTRRDTDMATAIDAALEAPGVQTGPDELARLLDVMARLRAPDGCPWDREQTFATIAPYTIEEAYEVADAIARDDMVELADELGDLLFQVVYYAQMASEAGLFDFATVAGAISDKMIRRHPHVFGNTGSPGWEEHKRQERAARRHTGTLAGIAAGLPALTRALKITNRVGRVGFDWPDAECVLRKLEEEIAEVRAELPAADPVRLGDEVGDVLFVAANLARKLGLDPEACLRGANDKFSRRFEAVEQRLAAAGLTLPEAGLERMEAEWQAVKGLERAPVEP